MKRNIKLLLFMIIAFISFTTITKVEAAVTAPSTITMGTGSQLPGYISGLYFAEKVTSNGKFAYCTDFHLHTPNGMVMTLVGAKDSGVTYIVQHGYPYRSFTGNGSYDYYITQSAVWWYLDDTTGSNNLKSSFKTTGSDPHGLRKYIIALVKEAKKARSNGYVKPSVSFSANSNKLTLSADRSYYYSDYITVKGKSVSGNIVVSLSGAPSGSVLIASNGRAKTSFKSGAKFRIRVPASKVSNLKYSMTISASATGYIEKAYMYKPANPSYQPVVVAVPFKETKTVKTTKKFTLQSAQLSIIKLDSETEKPLSGAKLQLKKSNGEVVAEWTTKTSEQIIKNLPAGTYKIVEVEAPKGYKLNTYEQEVVLAYGTLTKVKYYNTKKEPTKLVVIKRDTETGKTLEGAKFVLKNAKGEIVTSWVSSSKGHYVQGLPEGEYTVEEVSAPDGYIKSDEVKKVVLESGKTVTVTFYNDAIKGALNIVKIDGETGEKLAGAVLELKDEDGNIIESWTTTEDVYVIDKLDPGKYYVSEKKAPSGYVLSTEIVEIEITKDGGTKVVTFKNIPKIEVPNTGSNISKLAIVIGAISAGIGGTIVYRNAKKEN